MNNKSLVRERISTLLNNFFFLRNSSQFFFGYAPVTSNSYYS